MAVLTASFIIILPLCDEHAIRTLHVNNFLQPFKFDWNCFWYFELSVHGKEAATLNNRSSEDYSSILSVVLACHQLSQHSYYWHEVDSVIFCGHNGMDTVSMGLGLVGDLILVKARPKYFDKIVPSIFDYTNHQNLSSWDIQDLWLQIRKSKFKYIPQV